MIRLALFAASLAGLMSCSHGNPAAFTGPRPAADLVRFQACDDASDCIRVDNGCCNCANGGSTTAINRKFEDEFRSQFDCRNVLCSQRAGDCLFREPACVKGHCELGPQIKRFPMPN